MFVSFLIFLALRQQGYVICAKIQSKIARCGVLRSFRRAAFWQDKKNHEGNTRRYSRGIFRRIGGKQLCENLTGFNSPQLRLYYNIFLPTKQEYSTFFLLQIHKIDDYVRNKILFSLPFPIAALAKVATKGDFCIEFFSSGNPKTATKRQSQKTEQPHFYSNLSSCSIESAGEGQDPPLRILKIGIHQIAGSNQPSAPNGVTNTNGVGNEKVGGDSPLNWNLTKRCHPSKLGQHLFIGFMRVIQSWS